MSKPAVRRREEALAADLDAGVDDLARFVIADRAPTESSGPSLITSSAAWRAAPGASSRSSKLWRLTSGPWRTVSFQLATPTSRSVAGGFRFRKAAWPGRMRSLAGALAYGHVILPRGRRCRSGAAGDLLVRSSVISSHWEIHPAVRAIAKITVNIRRDPQGLVDDPRMRSRRSGRACAR